MPGFFAESRAPQCSGAFSPDSILVVTNSCSRKGPPKVHAVGLFTGNLTCRGRRMYACIMHDQQQVQVVTQVTWMAWQHESMASARLDHCNLPTADFYQQQSWAIASGKPETVTMWLHERTFASCLPDAGL